MDEKSKQPQRRDTVLGFAAVCVNGLFVAVQILVLTDVEGIGYLFVVGHVRRALVVALDIEMGVARRQFVGHVIHIAPIQTSSQARRHATSDDKKSFLAQTKRCGRKLDY